MKQPAALWKLRARGIEEGRQAVKRGHPEGLHQLRLALRRVAMTAAALGKKRVARRARALARRLSGARRLAVDLGLLERVGRLGLLSADALTAMAARWEKPAARAARRLARVTEGRPMQQLRRRLARLARKGTGNGIARLVEARRRAEKLLAGPFEGKENAELRRYGRAVERARALADDMVALGLPEPPDALREKAVQEALVRWRDLRTFRRRLARSRRESERRGAVILAGELRHLIAALDPVLVDARAAAVSASRPTGKVVPMRPAASRARA